ncbi:DUF6685 family protein [Paraburkholderia phenazinium]|uniref:DUF6685 family protein n=1 Tax=Paraburkholderia phenazinium TaxID=60549 RepID=UPI00158C5F1C|nr:DUF6685 family protein [Paraburkholderia phenazinium]
MFEYSNSPMRLSKEALAAVPRAVAQRESWTWWRRKVERPSVDDKARMLAWLALKDELQLLDPATCPAALDVRGSGIWGGSLRRADFLREYNEAALSLEGLSLTPTGLRSGFVTCPAGSIASTRNVADFAFDITDVDGISNSKSANRYFGSVNDFGLDFSTYKKVAVDEAGLQQMLNHYEVRIVQPRTTDRLGMRLWDGRLFLYNAGGSHHFAGAAYIAGQLQRPVPLRASLEVIALNECVIDWLLALFVPLAIPVRLVSKLRRLCAAVLGSAYTLPIPGVVAAGAAVLLLPASTNATTAVYDLLSTAGISDARPWFESLVAEQRRNLPLLRLRFPAAFAEA